MLGLRTMFQDSNIDHISLFQKKNITHFSFSLTNNLSNILKEDEKQNVITHQLTSFLLLSIINVIKLNIEKRIEQHKTVKKITQ